MKSGKEIRQDFINFFKNKEHEFVHSAPVIPYDDPTLLFTIAGMNQFKDVFLGTGKREYSRAVNSQKCIRAGGKHNDLDDVGKDSYHHSFFEMLGNWSFGDYYKREAIQWAWELLTEVWKLDKKRLHASVYTDDQEAEDLWKEVTDIDPKQITRHGERDNFWAMGDEGPCGPCSEIHYDRGEEYCNKKDEDGHVCRVNGSCDRIIEIWNLVFMQYNRAKDGSLTELPQKHVDTGMGFERICMVLQNEDSNYHIDIFRDLIKEIEEISGKQYSAGPEGTPFRVIADHLRALAFAISDGAIPSNEGRGYVLRRILRRASRYGAKIGLDEPFIYKLVPTLAEVMGEDFVELKKYLKHTQNIIKSEEESFLRTLSRGIDLFNKYVEDDQLGKKVIDGAAVFKLYDTFGFPVDLTKQMAEEIGYYINEEEFLVLMQKQKEQSKKNQKFKQAETIDWIELNSKAQTDFCGYDELTGEAKIIKYYIEKDSLNLVLENSYFYAESGGQVSDKGTITIDDVDFDVTKIKKDGEYFILSVKFKGAVPRLDKDTIVFQKVDKKFRDDCRIHHSSTHLLQSAMKAILGDHVAQSGSFVSNEILRFDYSYFEKLTAEQILAIETRVNDYIRANALVKTEIKSLEEAKKTKAIALFGEKYKDAVRIVSMGDFSIEFCGGTHVERTGDIGYFKILTESSLATGIRRIEAVCGNRAVEVGRFYQDTTSAIKERLICTEKQIIERFDKLAEDKKSLEKEIAQLKEKLSELEVLSLLDQKKELNGISVLATLVKVEDSKMLKFMGEKIREKMKSGICLLGADFGAKCGLVCAVTDDLKMQYKAGDIIKFAAKFIQGGGGGAPHIATAGGKDSSKLNEAISSLADYLA